MANLELKSLVPATVRSLLMPIALLGALMSLGGIALAGEPPAENPTTGKLTPEAATEAKRDFTLHVLPMLKAKCFGCHGSDAKEIKGELDVRSLDGLLKGGESGEPSIVPGQARESLLYQAIQWDGLEMPPKENDRLRGKQIAHVRNWIERGALWPTDDEQDRFRAEATKIRETADGVIFETSGGTSEDWTNRRYAPDDLWAFRPLPKSIDLVKEVTDSTDSNGSSDVNPIDRFIQRKLADSDFHAADEADPRTLVRRATFDLIGLPPTPEEVEAFSAAWKMDAKQAWTDLVERHLASPHYGERWAQHWLDVARYADTGGMSNDYERSNMWRYRDYVIRAFNENKPYDQFIVEQIAGDELADESVRKRSNGDEAKVIEAQLSGDYTEEEAEWIVATGFLRLGPWDNAMVEADAARQIYLDDIVNIVGQAFLSTTMRCVKCHDHKFDPIPTRDYYRMYAAFSTTQMAERPAPFLRKESRTGFESGKQHVQRMLKFAVAEKDRLVAKRETAAKAWFKEHGLEYKNKKDRQALPDDKKPPRHVGLDYVDEGQLKVREQDEWIWTRRLERYEPMAQSVYNVGATKLAWNGARKLRIDKKADRRMGPESYILTGGALTALGDAVKPGVLSVTQVQVSTDGSDDPFLITETVGGRRLELARWIADSRNPLTARSFVNRIWQYHFGEGIARNANNFGAKGAKPTHPDLLDYLAADFVENGWDVKRLHRLIMSSATYRQSSHHANQKRLAEKDPNNEWWAYFPPRRLTAEELRDAMLLVTGELNSTVGGLPVKPEINMEVALQPRMIQFSLAPAYQPSPLPTQRNRRTIYAYRTRGQADPFLELFNKPNPNDSCEFRDVAAVTPQVFTLMNSDMVTDRTIALAIRLSKSDTDLAAQIDSAFQLSFSRSATASERNRLTTYVQDMIDYHRKHEAKPVSYPTSITRSVVEEFSGKPFEYQEILPVFEAYKADSKSVDVSPEVRALADMCLLLFNTNEFIFLK